MKKEIERKFLVDFFDVALAYDSIDIKQGYIFSNDRKVVRVRTCNEKAFLTVKYRVSSLTRGEYEYEIPYNDACDLLLNACDGKYIKKTRYLYDFCGNTWEIDIFDGSLKGLILAEIELDSEEEEFQKPDFVKEDVSDNLKYSNHNLLKGQALC